MKFPIDYILASFLVSSAYYDLTERRIPNEIVTITALTGALCGGKLFMISFSGALLLSIIISRFRIIGAGDLKILSVITGFLNPERCLIILFLSLAVAAVFSIFLLITRRSDIKSKIPMAVFLLCGFIIWRLYA